MGKQVVKIKKTKTIKKRPHRKVVRVVKKK